MSDALLPFESEEEMAAHFFQEPDPKVASSFWEDEVDEDGNVKRSAERMAGTDDLTDWAQAVATAMITPVDPASLQHAMRGMLLIAMPCYSCTPFSVDCTMVLVGPVLHSTQHARPRTDQCKSLFYRALRSVDKHQLVISAVPELCV